MRRITLALSRTTRTASFVDSDKLPNRKIMCTACLDCRQLLTRRSNGEPHHALIKLAHRALAPDAPALFICQICGEKLAHNSIRHSWKRWSLGRYGMVHTPAVNELEESFTT